MRTCPLLLLGLTAACAGAQRPAPPRATLAFTDVRVFDGERVIPGAVVLVDGDRITAVGPGVAVPPGVELVDGRGKTLLPGLIDGHVHTWNEEQLRQALAFGVTTVLDMFMPAELVAKLHPPAPDRADLYTAGVLATAPGGHGTEYGFKIPTLTKPEEAAAFVDARLAEGSDWIKLVLDDGSIMGKTWPTLSSETAAALVAAAHARGKLAVAHITSYAGARAALEAGVDGLVHIFGDREPPPDFAAFVASRHAFVTPTLVVLRSAGGRAGVLADDPAVADYLSPEARASLRQHFGPGTKVIHGAGAAAVAALRDAHVPILAGTDSGNPGTTMGASIHDELVLLVVAGLSPTQALAAATSVPARVFHLADRGRVAAGLRADLLLVDGDPTDDITATRRIAAVWHDGKRFDREAYRAALPKAAAPGEGAKAGVISDFEDGSDRARLGKWMPSTDALVGGTSTVETKVVDRALSITGELVTGKAPAAWAGAMWLPGAQPFEPVDLSAAKGIRFRARGDGKQYTVMVFARSRGRRPSVQTFTAGPAAAVVEMAWSSFDGSDGKDIMAVLIGDSVSPGKFALVVDDVELR